MLLNPSIVGRGLPPTNMRHTSVSVTATSSIILPGAATRTWFMLQNTGTIPVYVALGAAASLANGFLLAAGGSFIGTADLNWIGDVTAITASGTNTVKIFEAVSS